MVTFIQIGIIGGGAYIAYKIYNAVMESRKKLKGEGKSASVTELAKETGRHAISVEQRYPKDIQELNSKALGGQPEFYNEADHSRGRFLGWTRTTEDRSDMRVIEGDFYRARILKDVKYLGFFKASKEEITPCVFRPHIDAVFKAPGEEPGVPPEGIVVFKRSLDGIKLAFGHDERYRLLLIDERHKRSIMADMLHNMREKERLLGAEDASKDLSEEIENKLKRSKKMHDAASGRSAERDITAPYTNEMYGDEDSLGAGQTGSEGLWKFES